MEGLLGAEALPSLLTPLAFWSILELLRLFILLTLSLSAHSPDSSIL
jgi:hypothetical protein